MVHTSKAEPFSDSTPGHPAVRGFLHRTSHAAIGSIALTHGAGGNAKSPLLVALADEFASIGFNVLRCDLSFRQRRPTGPPSPSDSKHDQEGLRRAVSLMSTTFGGRAYLGGASYGGRQASMLVASEPALVEGLLLLSYPLHPPGRPGQMRMAHFPQLQTPVLFVSGTRDAFGSTEELQAAVRLIPGRSDLFSVEGAGHGLRQKSNREALPGTIVREFQSFFLRSARSAPE